MATLTDLKLYLGISGTDQDTILTIFLDSAKGIIKNYIGRELEATDYTDIINGNAQREIILPNYPLNSIASISYNTGTTETPVWEELPQTDYTYKSKTANIYTLYHLSRGFQNYKIEYNAGYVTMPSEIELCELKLASKYYNSRSSDGIKSETVNGDRIEFDGSEIPNDIMVILSKYRDI